MNGPGQQNHLPKEGDTFPENVSAPRKFIISFAVEMLAATFILLIILGTYYAEEVIILVVGVGACSLFIASIVWLCSFAYMPYREIPRFTTYTFRFLMPVLAVAFWFVLTSGLMFGDH